MYSYIPGARNWFALDLEKRVAERTLQLEVANSYLEESMQQAKRLAGEAQAAKSERSIIASKSKAKSGGIQIAALSRDTGGSALSG